VGQFKEVPAIEGVQVSCDCHVDQKLIDLLEEVFGLSFEQLPDIEESLLHSEAFHTLCDAVFDDDCDHYTVMADAIRCGIEMGRRMNEIKGLERMVGINKKYDKKRKVKK
jgi:hypothetical protein